VRNNDDGILEAVSEGDEGTVLLRGGNLKGAIETDNVIIELG
jgi:hypothetical protein